MNWLTQMVLSTVQAPQPKPINATVARYKAKLNGQFCAKEAARVLKIRHKSAYDTLQRLADDGMLLRTETINQGHGRPTQFYKWPE